MGTLGAHTPMKNVDFAADMSAANLHFVHRNSSTGPHRETTSSFMGTLGAHAPGGPRGGGGAPVLPPHRPPPVPRLSPPRDPARRRG